MQEFGVNLLIRQEAIDRSQAEERAIRNAVLAGGGTPHLVYPDIFPAPAVDEADLSDEGALFQGDTRYDYSGVTQLDAQSFEADLEAMMAENDHVVVTEAGEWH